MEHTRRDYRLRFFSIILFAVLTVIGTVFSVYLLLYADTLYTYTVAVLFLVLSLISGFFNVTTSYWYYRSFFYKEHLDGIRKALMPLKVLPTVAVAVPVFNEDPKTVERSLLSLKGMNYPKGKLRFYLLDDSDDVAIASELERFSKSNQVTYLHRGSRKGYKAGALNNMLKHSKEDFVAVFDYDERLTDRDFLVDTLPYFSDKSVSYVQTEKRYAKGNLFSDSIDLFDAFFFRFVQPARALNNTAIFAGSCGIIRKSALDDIGGFPEYIIEDTFFSFESDMKNYKSLYLPKVYAHGRPIRRFSELAKQQWRYNYGDTQFLKYFFSRRSEARKKRQLSQISGIEYMTHGFGLNYLSSILLLFTLASVLIVFSSFPVAHVTLNQLFLTKNISLDLEILGVGALLLSIAMPIVLTKLYFGSAKKGVMIFIVNFALAGIRARAGLNAFFNLNPKFKWSRPKLANKLNILPAIRNSAFEIVLASVLLVFGTAAIAVDNFFGGMWLFWYSFLYSSTFYFFYKYG
ncbi:MAG: glycosyltransferase [Candidatus Marsarchaeota archaeon]|jgi:cellulose synthase (UDP-forming)|nr:glycosyltransferase [Candidatus Marsarchaeota archaeon]